jgi:anaerobic magnesium-protoporphyrin IX monomethyl ester cyclase
MRVTLIHPPTVSTPTTMVQEAVPPLGLAYVAAAVVAAGHTVTVVDAVGDALDTFTIWSSERRIMLRGLGFAELIARVPLDADVIGVSCMFSNAWRPTRDLLTRLREARPGARIVLGGEHATACHAYIFETTPGVDYCVLGEGERTFCQLLEALEGGVDPRAIAGVAARPDPTRPGAPRPASRLATTPAHLSPLRRRPRIREIGAIAEPAWELFPLDAYITGGYNHGIQRGRTMPILASRGCPYQCTFCSSPNMWTTKWAAREPREVVAEMARYVERYGATDFAFYDLTAIVRREWIIEFCSRVLAEGLGVTWQLPSGTRSEAIDAEVARLLRRSGCRNMNYAPESGAPGVLARIKKRVSLDRMVRSIREAVDNGIDVKVNIILGFPDETPREVLETYRFLVDLAVVGVEAVSVFPFCPYPGSELFDELVRRGSILLDDDYFDSLVFTDLGRLVSYNSRSSTAELRAMVFGALSVFHGVQLVTHPLRVVDMATQIVRRQQGSKIANAVEPMRVRRRAWGRLAARG